MRQSFQVFYLIGYIIMTKSELLKALSSDTGMSQTKADKFLSAFVDAVKNCIKSGDSITIPGLGTFSKGERAARSGVNPRTGESITIPASNVAKFKSSKTVKDFLN